MNSINAIITSLIWYTFETGLLTWLVLNHHHYFDTPLYFDFTISAGTISTLLSVCVSHTLGLKFVH